MRKRNPKPQDIDKAVERLLKIRPRSVGELRHRLLLKGFPEEVVEQMLERLQAAGLLDDKAFAQWWIEQRAIAKPTGAFGLTMELRQKRVEKEVIDQAIVESGVKESELELAREALGRRLYRYEKLDPLTRRKRVADFLARRGFSREVIATILKQEAF